MSQFHNFFSQKVPMDYRAVCFRGYPHHSEMSHFNSLTCRRDSVYNKRVISCVKSQVFKLCEHSYSSLNKFPF